MKLWSLLVPFLLVAASLPATGQDLGGSERCSLMEGSKRRLLALDYQAFDQQPGGGWRGLVEAGCSHTAAEIVEAYIDKYPDRATAHPVLYFHAGQIRAFLDERETAIRQMQKAIALNEKQTSRHGPHWSTYVAATIAFLKRDEAGLRRLYDRLRGRIDGPSGAPPAFDRTKRGEAEHIRIIRGLIDCLDRPYREAYGGCQRG